MLVRWQVLHPSNQLVHPFGHSTLLMHSPPVHAFSTVVSVLSTLLLSVGLTFWGGSG